MKEKTKGFLCIQGQIASQIYLQLFELYHVYPNFIVLLVLKQLCFDMCEHVLQKPVLTETR